MICTDGRRGRLPRYVKLQCIGAVQGYEARRREYAAARDDIIHPGGKKDDVSPSSPFAARIAESTALRLENLEAARWVQEMRAVERAEAKIGAGQYPESQAKLLRRAVYLNCLNGRRYPFERVNAGPAVSRSGFYRARQDFLTDIAEELGLI